MQQGTLQDTQQVVRKPVRRWSGRSCGHAAFAVSARFSAATEALAAASDEALLTAALGCSDEAEFLATLRRWRAPDG